MWFHAWRMIRFDSDNSNKKESNPTSEEAQGSFRQLRALSFITTIDFAWVRRSPADSKLIPSILNQTSPFFVFIYVIYKPCK